MSNDSFVHTLLILLRKKENNFVQFSEDLEQESWLLSLPGFRIDLINSATLEGVQMAQDSPASHPAGLRSKRSPPENFLGIAARSLAVLKNAGLEC